MNHWWDEPLLALETDTQDWTNDPILVFNLTTDELTAFKDWAETYGIVDYPPPHDEPPPVGTCVILQGITNTVLVAPPLDHQARTSLKMAITG